MEDHRGPWVGDSRVYHFVRVKYKDFMDASYIF